MSKGVGWQEEMAELYKLQLMKEKKTSVGAQKLSGVLKTPRERGWTGKSRFIPFIQRMEGNGK